MLRGKMKKKGGSVHLPEKKVIKAPEKQQRLVAERNVERMKAEGWKVVGNSKELTLMEK